MADYDISEAFQRIEEEMIASMSRNLKRHLRTEDEEGLNYTMWQAEQLNALHNFKKNNKKLFKSYFSTINGKIDEILRKANETGRMTQEVAILEAIKNGYARYSKNDKSVIGEFFKINERKLNALIKATTNDMKKGETAMLRRVNDEYRKIIYNAEVYYNTGVGTLPQAVDMATKDFLSRGISCIEYANGARVGIDSYAKMALRTAQTRAYLLGEASKRDEWGISTVIVNKRGVACPMCLKYVGKVFYDDVWGNASIPSPAEYPLLSEAIKGGLYHPNCKDVHTTYFEGVNTPPEPMTEEEKKEAARVYNLEQQQRYNERQIRKYKRLSDGSVDPENRDRYYKKLSEWQETQKNFVKANGDVLKRRYENESIHGIGPIDNKDTRRTVAQMKREVAMEKASGSSSLHNNNISVTSKTQNDDIISEKRQGKVTEITDEAINRVPYADIYGLSDEDNKFIQDQHKELLRYAKDNNNNNEVAFVFRSDFSEKTIFKGSVDELNLNTKTLNKGSGLFVMHNHPKNSSYSLKDIAFLLDNDDVTTLSIVKNNGAIETLTKTATYNKQDAKIRLSRLLKQYVKNYTDNECDKAITKFIEKSKEELIWSTNQ